MLLTKRILLIQISETKNIDPEIEYFCESTQLHRYKSEPVQIVDTAVFIKIKLRVGLHARTTILSDCP